MQLDVEMSRLGWRMSKSSACFHDPWVERLDAIASLPMQGGLQHVPPHHMDSLADIAFVRSELGGYMPHNARLAVEA